jgi:hypothetical protein
MSKLQTVRGVSTRCEFCKRAEGANVATSTYVYLATEIKPVPLCKKCREAVSKLPL